MHTETQTILQIDGLTIPDVNEVNADLSTFLRLSRYSPDEKHCTLEIITQSLQGVKPGVRPQMEKHKCEQVLLMGPCSPRAACCTCFSSYVLGRAQ